MTQPQMLSDAIDLAVSTGLLHDVPSNGVRPPDVANPMMPPPSFDKIGDEYVRQIVDLSPGQRKRYLGQLQVLAGTPVRGSLISRAAAVDRPRWTPKAAPDR
jgi:hypothetical protein